MEQQRYEQLLNADWQEVFYDPCTKDWRANWQLDGKQATITHSDTGMDFSAGPTAFDDACHAVLWSKDSFTGDLMIDYEYTRLDDAIRFVTIIYIHATGAGEEPFSEDIMDWAHLRETPAMRMYFNHMKTYHVSYAAFDGDNEDPDADYIRSRRYMPETGGGLEGTDLPPDHYMRTGLFDTGVPHKITLIKTDGRIFMSIDNGEKTMLCHWDTDRLPSVDHGRIGLRHMFTRSARYKDIRVSIKPKD